MTTVFKHKHYLKISPETVGTALHCVLLEKESASLLFLLVHCNVTFSILLCLGRYLSKICLFLYGESSVPLSSLTMEFSRSLSVITMIFGVPLTFRLPSLISSFCSTQLATSEFCLCNPLLPESDAYSSCLLGGTRLAVSYAFEVVTFFRP